jgi:hypothetical protein
VVAAFALVTGLCLWGKPWHMDEPFFLAIARQILKDPLRPLAFSFNWYGSAVPMGSINNTPPLLGYLLAGALKLTGGSEFWTRALFFPFDLAAAWGLLALASRFLKKPLLPVLVVLAGPAWTINMHHMMAERLMAAFAMPCVWLFVKAVDDGDPRAKSASAVLAGLAVLSKYNAIFLIPTAVAYAWSRGKPLRSMLAWSLTAVSGALAWQAWSLLSGSNPGLAAWAVTAEASAGFWSSPSHKARALLAFTGGLGVLNAFAGFALRLPRRGLLVCGGAAALLFLPALDLAPLVRGVDRATGFLLAFGTLASLAALGGGPRTAGRALWAPWLGAVQLAYWSVLARFVVFLLPPLVFWLAERLEAERPSAAPRLLGAALAGALLLSLGLGGVDWTYAAAQKRTAAVVAAGAGGGPLWTTAHWGLQEYLAREGGRPLDLAAGGWDAVEPGGLVVVTRVNSNALKPRRPIAADVSSWTVTHPLPLRHISGWTGEGAFYSSVMGFLPWSLSSEPVEEFTLVRRR